ncbi:NnrS family protein [Nitratireductor aquibiodomus RA22]|uniref:NnrS family protein n=1 Tax=Nitratireductor aquibiodomus RA22 TaxID=1189611 RepID=I5BT07_9HYPH|nr:NnrS family protein [Nitratireductor aquibiodomus]EIM72709.1 NnrS family protein [Nitratireductor aquibiodomus RA22]
MSTGADPAGTDKSVLRTLRRAGDTSRDGRGRVTGMPPILHYGFRPFFFLAALHAGIAIPAWLSIYFSGQALPGPFAGLHWHAHEMLFGYLQAVVAGFVLTAIPNWTGRLPLSGWPLIGLVFLWTAGRVACAALADPFAAMAVDAAFPAVLAFAVWREVVAGRNWKNAPVALMISLFGMANVLDHAANVELVAHGVGIRLALAAIVMLLALIGGRIVPSFTRNWLVKRGGSVLPASFGLLDKAALASTIVACMAWIVTPGTTVTGFMLILSGALLGARLARWRGHKTATEPIVLILHVGYAWLAVALVLLGMAFAASVPESAALHALTAGAIGTMTLAVMTRASLGHTGREIVADRLTVASYVAVTAGAILRVSAPFAGDWYASVLVAGGTLWSAAFLLFAIRYASILWGRRQGA